MGILLTYPESPRPRARMALAAPASRPEAGVVVGLLGAGNHVRDMLLPHIKAGSGVSIRWVCTATSVSADSLGGKLGVAGRTTDYREVLADEAVNTVVIGARHGAHAAMVLDSLAAGKHVFVEKPLCLTEDELERIAVAYEAAAARGQRLMVGFNRRFSEHARQIKAFFEGRREPLVMNYRVNAGAVPSNHWVQDPDDGGGRIIGEACHFLDLMQFICGSEPVAVRGIAIGRHSTGITSDQSILTIRFGDGSVGSITYAAGGDPALPKERFEVFGSGKAAVLDDFGITSLAAGNRLRHFKTAKRDKGFSQEIEAFVTEVRQGGAPAMPFGQIEAVTRACILLDRSLQSGQEYLVAGADPAHDLPQDPPRPG
jgi:predicted dehydrogenase